MQGLTRRGASLGLAAAASACVASGRQAGQEDSLHGLALAKGLRFGSAVGAGPAGSLTGSLDDPRNRAVLSAECGLLVPENELKWYVLRPDAATFDFSRADRIAAFAAEQGMALRGHTLLWHHPRWFPGWLNAHDFGPRPVVEVERLLIGHVQTVCRRYAGRIGSWDVVNEAVDSDTGALRETVFSKPSSPLAVIETAFRAAREALPDAQLVYNDYMSWEAGHEAHRAGVLRLLEALKGRGVSVDALGVQSHIGSGNADESIGFDTRQEREWRRFLDEATGMGLDLLITEFDVHDKNLPSDFAARDAEVAALARGYLDMMLSYPQTRDVLAWGMSDRYSWLQNQWPRADGLGKRPAIYDEDFRPKPLRRAVAAVFQAASPRRPVG